MPMLVSGPRSGFTLVEMAMVLVIIGFVTLAVLPALTALRMGTQRSVTQTNLQALMTATAAYAQANGCLPCPTPASTIGGGFGFVAGLTTGTACANCASAPEGIAPFASLGVPSSTAHDGWGHWITMRVDPALTANFGVAPPTMPATCTCTLSGGKCLPSPAGCNCASPVNNQCSPSFSASIQGMCAASVPNGGTLSKTNSIKVQTPGANFQYAAVVFVSHGVSGGGSFIASPTAYNNSSNGSWLLFPAGLASCAASGYAECNSAQTNSTLFYNSIPIVTGAYAYDDMLAYADRNTLVSMLGNGSCQTVW